MNFVVEQVGKIHKADIALDGITVIAGPNGSGKSTIGRALMTLSSVLRRLPFRLIEERRKSLREAVDGVFKAHDLPEVGYCFFNDDDKSDFLKSETWQDIKVIEEQLLQYPSYRFDDECNAAADAEKIVAIKGEIVSAIAQVIDRKNDYYLPSIFADSFVTALGRGFSSSESDSDPCFVRLTTDENASSFIQFGGDKIDGWKVASTDKAPLAFYFEPIHLLDLYADKWSFRIRSRVRCMPDRRYNAPDADWREFLYEEVDRTEWSVERKKKQDEIDKTLDELLTVIRGHLEKTDSELCFLDDDVQGPVQVMNVASGIKTMSAIEKGIRAGVIQPGCLLIVDEPESNLHPQWQIEFARFLVKLNAQFGMRFLLNTHSPFFLKAVEVFSREEECGKRTHYYHMVRNGEAFGYDTKELTDGTNEIFKTYFDAMNDLMSR